MERAFLEECLARGLSLESIGGLVDRHPSTVSYWMNKHGLVALNRARHQAKGRIERDVLATMVVRGMSVSMIAAELGVSVSKARYWLERHGLATEHGRALADTREARRANAPSVTRSCAHHGDVEFRRCQDGAYRCPRCNAEAVVRRRRRVKQTLVEEAGGRCIVCGYDRYVGALQFHHVDPAEKAFLLSRDGATRSIAEAREEARKCVLVCANCHAEVEAGIASVTVDPAARVLGRGRVSEVAQAD